jgi:hypothetical protein
MRSADLIARIEAFRKFRPNLLIATHLDQTHRWGGMFAAAECLQVPIAFVTSTPGGIGRLMSPDPVQVARHLIRMEVSENDK